MNLVSADSVTKIIAAAAVAPSGDNSQPWRFVVKGGTIEFHYLPEKDNPILNHEEGGTLIALGAALENAELEARAQGYEPHLTYPNNGSCVAVMELHAGGRLEEDVRPLHEVIFERHSNRKAYQKTPLTDEVKTALTSIFESGGTDLMPVLVESADAMQEVGRALTVMEEIALGNRTLHRLFFSDIFWSAEDNCAGKQGLYIKTLELPPPARALFRLLKHWCVAQALAAMGFPRVVARTNAEQNASASAFGIIAASHTNRMMYLCIGRMLERIWLFATSRGLSLQIVTGITFLAQSMKDPNTARIFTSDEQARVATAYETIKKHVDIGGSHAPILIFRVGMSDAPTDVSHRHAPDVTFVN